MEKQGAKTMTLSKNTDTLQHEFIMTLKKALGKSSDPALPELFGTRPSDSQARLNAYTHKSESAQKALLDLFMNQAKPLNLSVIPMENASLTGIAIQKLVQETTPEWGTQKSIIAWDHPLIAQLNLETLLAQDPVTFFTTKATAQPDGQERKKFREHLLPSYMGITSADFCVAESATLVMRAWPGQPRSVSLVPSIHIAVIKIDQIMENLTELYFRLKWDPKEKKQGLTNSMTFISGPSKTGDIELVMVDGAHGPRQMVVYVITG